MNKPSLQQLKFKHFQQKTKLLRNIKPKVSGLVSWVKFFRESLNMTQAQLAKKLGVTQPAIKKFEEAEAEGSITLKTLRKIADSLNADLVYGLVPRQNVDIYINEKALQMAKKKILAENHSMALENQAVDEKELNRRINNYAEELSKNLDRQLWD